MGFGFLRRLAASLQPRRGKRVSPSPLQPAAAHAAPATDRECTCACDLKLSPDLEHVHPRVRARWAPAAPASAQEGVVVFSLHDDDDDRHDGDEFAHPHACDPAAVSKSACAAANRDVDVDFDPFHGSGSASPRTGTWTAAAASVTSADSSSAGSPPPPPAPTPAPAPAPLELPPSALDLHSSSSPAYQRYLRCRLASAPSIGRVVGQIWSAIDIHAPRVGKAPDLSFLDFDRYTRTHLLVQRALRPDGFDPLVAASKAKRDWALESELGVAVSRRRFTGSILQICAAHCAGERFTVFISRADFEATADSHFFCALDFLWRLLDSVTIYDSSIDCRRLRACDEVGKLDVVAFAAGSPSPLAGPPRGRSPKSQWTPTYACKGEPGLSPARLLQRRAAANRAILSASSRSPPDLS